MDSTVACCGASTGDVRICGCSCGDGKWIMVLPMAFATFLRCILYIVLFSTLDDVLADDLILDSKEAIDKVFFIILTYAAFDAGPMVLLTMLRIY